MNDHSNEANRQMIAQGYARSKELFPKVEDISAEELLERSAEETFVIVDVRSPTEQAISMIKGAISSREFEKNRDDFRQSTVVTYCTIGHRSGLYAKKLQKQGFNVFNLAGSVLSWTHVGGEFQGKDGVTKVVHVGGPNFNFVAAGYESTW